MTRHLIIILFALLLVACGGGGDDSQAEQCADLSRERDSILGNLSRGPGPNYETILLADLAVIDARIAAECN
jgi:hypothetical protein